MRGTKGLSNEMHPAPRGSPRERRESVSKLARPEETKCA